MPAAKPGDVWIIDLGMSAKVRPCLVVTKPATQDEELNVFTVIAHTTSIRGSHWEISVRKPFLEDEGAFDVQRIATVAAVKLERRLGQLTTEEFDLILDRLAERLGI